MSKSRFLLLSGLAAGALVAACTPVEKPDPASQYWQRVSASELIYTRGPKAQQMLNRDIARCVTELRELERLGQLRNAIPTDPTGRVLDPDEKALYGYDSVDRDGYLLLEGGEYHDFETCMLAKGWERIKHVPYDVSEDSWKSYRKVHKDYEDLPEPETEVKPMTQRGPVQYGRLNN